LKDDPMPEIQRRAAQTIAEYIKIVDDLSPATLAGLWFRGHSKSHYRLVPGALRDITLITDGRGQPIREGQMVRASGSHVTGIYPERVLADFKRRAQPFIERSPTSQFEWMFLAQHHGLPTRLLDWSTNALVALYFAMSRASEADGDGSAACKEFVDQDRYEFRDDGGAVFVIDPGAINSAICDVPDPIDVSAMADQWAHYLDPAMHVIEAYSPICVNAPQISPRIRAQSGVFTLHGSNVWPLDYYDVLRPLITKIFIPYTATRAIKQSLAKIGITRSFILPDLDSIAYDVTVAEQIRSAAETKAHFRSVEENLAKPHVRKRRRKIRT
jgi:hypothetical protein